MAYEELEAARAAFLAAIDGLDEATWRARGAEGTWSIAEIAEHVALVSRDIGRMVRGPLLRTPPVEEPESGMEARIRTFLPDRSRKVVSPDRFLPVGTWATREALAAEYAASRDELLAWLRSTDAPLRAHKLPHPRLGPLDGVEWLVFLAEHDRRHVAQIEEAKRPTV
jgi:uncharacterized damage-inducible protein DinB